MSFPGYIVYLIVNDKKCPHSPLVLLANSGLSSQTVSAHNLGSLFVFQLIPPYFQNPRLSHLPIPFFIILQKLPRIADNVCNVRNQLQRDSERHKPRSPCLPATPPATYSMELCFHGGVARQNCIAYLPVSRAASRKLCESPDRTKLMCP